MDEPRKTFEQMLGNPWGLTKAQVKAVEAVVETGSLKKAATQLGLSHRTVEAQFRALRDVMLCPSFRALVLWDRWARIV